MMSVVKENTTDLKILNVGDMPQIASNIDCWEGFVSDLSCPFFILLTNKESHREVYQEFQAVVSRAVDYRFCTLQSQQPV